jgi:hypothetical protein
VIAARPTAIPYLSALLPSELELQTLEETDSSEQDDQTDSDNTAGNGLNVSLGLLDYGKIMITIIWVNILITIIQTIIIEFENMIKNFQHSLPKKHIVSENFGISPLHNRFK